MPENASDLMAANERSPTAVVPLTAPSAPWQLEYAVADMPSQPALRNFGPKVVIAFMLLLLVLLLVLRRPQYSLAPWMGARCRGRG